MSYAGTVSELSLELQVLAAAAETASAVVLVTAALLAFAHDLDFKTAVFAVVDLILLHVVTM
ncbi:hypothetical protein EU546_08455 [Candidatus Thorarchaeota archaeon]|nr:MAG: hypothetical protein EU546_08455 [Candidatus Thorarchaeota archaeon]